jgi:ABC-type nitrate/sulfonate/bicarbonate transport system substrate-binding protein
LLSESSGNAYEALLRSEHRHTYALESITPEVLAQQQAMADTFHALGVIPQAIRIQDAFIAPATKTASTP